MKKYGLSEFFERYFTLFGRPSLVRLTTIQDNRLRFVDHKLLIDQGLLAGTWCHLVHKQRAVEKNSTALPAFAELLSTHTRKATPPRRAKKATGQSLTVYSFQSVIA